MRKALTKADIEKSGATSVTDLIQMLPSMQNFVPAASSVNGGGAGVTTAALHSLPSKYTLVRLSGHTLPTLIEPSATSTLVITKTSMKPPVPLI